MMHQLFQMRTVDRAYFSYRMSNATELLYEGINNWERTDMKTCKRVKSYADYQIATDHYNYNGLNVEHKRSEAVDLLPFYFRTLLRDYRENYLNDENLKKNLKRRGNYCRIFWKSKKRRNRFIRWKPIYFFSSIY